MRCNYCDEEMFLKTPLKAWKEPVEACNNPNCIAFDEEALDDMNSDHDGGPLDATNGEFYDE